MKRLAYYYLQKWKDEKDRKPLLLRGARQVGKTYAARHLGKTFKTFIELNFELEPNLSKLFEEDLDPKRIIRDIQILKGVKIVPGHTLLFFDEIQECPKAITALRYFYEHIPELHVVAAGSLLEFATEMIGIPVGRVSSLHIYPLSFLEFLAALSKKEAIEFILNHSSNDPIGAHLHNEFLNLLGMYMAVGGMPEAVNSWKKYESAKKCFEVHSSLLETYKQDFLKYAKRNQLKYLNLIIDTIASQLGQKFKYSRIGGEYRKRELAPCLDLLSTAHIVHRIHHSSGNGIPIGAEANLEKFKTILLDVGLTQAHLNFDFQTWILEPKKGFVNKGPIIEAFVGQEILAYSNPQIRSNLYYWQKEVRGSSAEVDYLIQKGTQVIPIEVKGGDGKRLYSIRTFLNAKKDTSYGLLFSTENFFIKDQIYAHPLHAIAPVLNDEIKEAFRYF